MSLIRRIFGFIESSEPSTPVPSRTIYECAREVSERVGEVAHFSELLGDAPFTAAASELARSLYTDDELITYATSENGPLAALALAALGVRHESAGEGAPVTASILESINAVSGPARFFALHALGRIVPPPHPLIGRVAVAMNDDWSDTYDRAATQFGREFFRLRVRAGEPAALGGALEGASASRLDDVAALIRGMDAKLRKALSAELETFRSTRTNDEYLKTVGRVWEAPGKAEDVIPFEPHAAATAQIVESIEGEGRSILIVGAEGTGKSTVLRLAAGQLLERGWMIFEAGALEIMADQSYVGQLEGRMQRLLAAICGKRRVLWVIPSFSELLLAGQHGKSDTGILDIILPHVANGNIRIATELTNEAYQRLVERKPRVATALVTVRLEPATPTAAIKLATEWCAAHAAGTTDGSLITEASQLATQYLGMRAAPGNLIELLDRTHSRLKTVEEGSPDITLDDILVTLSQLTGLPSSILDDREGLDLEALRAHFLRRVLGQSEAIDTLVERVAMIKAGVTDPTRPAGVFLFAGPTGTGKTEIAKALAEFLFGSSDRMIRLDMSELKTVESLGRLVGEDADSTQSLVQSIRRQPFSVVLLDEFEKAHPNVWDLFLQVFDDGRLTDRRGVVADFRHSLIILTSNIGSAIQTTGRTGFKETGTAFASSNVLAALEREFRKELINRLDRVVVFRPLSRETMRGILRKELAEAFTRRGLRNRTWAADCDDSAIEFLLKQGFTSDLGARPLKRAVERYLLAPLAEAIVNRRTPDGDQFLFVTSDGTRLNLEFVDPDADGDQPVAELVQGNSDPRTSRELILSARGSADEMRTLRQELADMEKVVASATWTNAKSSALSMTALPEFWSARERFEVLSEVEQRERIESAVASVRLQFEKVASGKDLKPDEVKRIAQQIWLASLAIEDLERGRTTDALLMVETKDEAVAFGESLVAMYKRWSEKRGMIMEVLLEQNDGRRQRFVCSVSGFGAHTILSPEEGVHALEAPASHGSGWMMQQARVRIAGQPAEPGKRSLSKIAEQIFESIPASRLVVRRYREKPSPLVRDSVRRWRTGKLESVMMGNFDLIG